MTLIYTIETSEGSKGRSFKANCMAVLEVNAILNAPERTTRPLMALFSNTRSHLKAFVANLTDGHKAATASKYDSKLEFMKSLKYQTQWNHWQEGSSVNISLGDYFNVDPGMVDQNHIKFVVLASQKWFDAQRQKDVIKEAELFATSTFEQRQSFEGEFSEMAVLAYLWASYLDKRTKAPLIPDGKFYLQLLYACFSEGMVSFEDTMEYGQSHFFVHRYLGLKTKGFDKLGFYKPLAMVTTHDKFEALLASEVKKYLSYV